LQRPFDDFDCAHDTGAKTARLGEYHFHQDLQNLFRKIPFRLSNDDDLMRRMLRPLLRLCDATKAADVFMCRLFGSFASDIHYLNRYLSCRLGPTWRRNRFNQAQIRQEPGPFLGDRLVSALDGREARHRGITPETAIIDRKYRFLSSTMAASGVTFTLDQMVNPHRSNREAALIVQR